MVNCGGVKAAMARARAPIVLLVLALGGGLLLRNDFTAAKQPKAPEARLSAGTAETAFGRLPLAFEPNQGQSDARVKFLAHGAGYGIFLTASEAVLSLPSATGQSVLDMQLVGSQIGSQNAARVEGLAQLPGHSNYFIGNDRSRWRTNIPQFSHVLYSGVYPGIDLDFYGKQGRLEYDFDVNPGADFRQIELDFSGAEDVRLARDGSLVVRLNGREVRFDSPKIYQQSVSGHQHVGGGFVVRNDRRVAFEVGEYDRSRTLIIDPVLTFSTFLGGTGDESCAKITGAAQFVAHCPSVAVDAAQRVYMAGVTSDSSTFPIPAGGASDIPSPLLPDPNVFVTRINSSGTAVDFTTFIGGSGLEYPVGVAIDSGFNVYVAGTTNSADFPTTAAAFQPSATGTHVFFSKLGQDGSANEYSTYLAGSGTDIAASLAVDGQGLAYLFGTTSSPDFPVTPTALQGTALATNQFFFSKLNTSANVSGPNTLAYSTFIGGSSPSTGTVTGGAIAVDSANPANVYIAGGTTFTDMPLLNASQPTFPSKTTGTNSVWLARLNAPANNTQQYTPSFETYFGGSGDDIAYGVATDGTNTLLTGSTTSPNITIPSGVAPFQACLDQSSPNQTPCPSNVTASDAFVAKFGLPAVTGTTQGMVPLSYFTYLGGTGTDVGLAIVSDAGVSTGNVRVTGLTGDSSSWSAPVQNKLGPGGATDAFLARILTTTTTTTTTTTANTSTVTFLGGSNTDIGTSLAEDVDLNTYIVGETFSGNFPTAAQPGSAPLQSAIGGTNDAFVSKLGPNVNGLLSFVCNSSAPVSGPGCPSPKPANPTVNPTPVGIGNTIKFVYSIYNQGDPVTGVVFTDTVQGTNSTIASATVGGGSATGGTSSGTCTVGSGAGGGGTTAICNLGTVNTSNTTTTTSGSTTKTTTEVAAQVTVTVNATVPAATGVIPPKPPDVGNIGQLSVPSINFSSLPASGSAQVNDFGIEPAPGSPTSQTVTAGDTATYSLQLVPTGPIPEAVTLSATGAPTQASPSFSPQSIPNLNNGPQSVTLKISTAVRVTTPASLFRHGGWSYAIWLPISGLALLGGSLSRRRRVLLAMSFAALLIVLALQPACGYGTKNTSSTTGTPAGTYNITVNAVSGGTRSTVVQLVVK